VQRYLIANILHEVAAVVKNPSKGGAVIDTSVKVPEGSVSATRCWKGT
jgi:hypothetical protein